MIIQIPLTKNSDTTEVTLEKPLTEHDGVILVDISFGRSSLIPDSVQSNVLIPLKPSFGVPGLGAVPLAMRPVPVVPHCADKPAFEVAQVANEANILVNCPYMFLKALVGIECRGTPFALVISVYYKISQWVPQ